MRLFLLAAAAIASFAGAMTVETTDANALVCARGVFRAGCVGRYGGGVVVRRPFVGRGVIVRRPFYRRRVIISDMMLKHDLTLLGHLDNGLGFYRFSYNGSDKAYVGVMAQEVQTIMPEAVVRGSDGYLRVFYDKLGVKLQTYDEWVATGARLPSGAAVKH